MKFISNLMNRDIKPMAVFYFCSHCGELRACVVERQYRCDCSRCDLAQCPNEKTHIFRKDFSIKFSCCNQELVEKISVGG